MALSSDDQLLVLVLVVVVVDSAAVVQPSPDGGSGSGLPSRLDGGVLPPTRFTAWHRRPITFNRSIQQFIY